MKWYQGENSLITKAPFKLSSYLWFDTSSQKVEYKNIKSNFISLFAKRCIFKTAASTSVLAVKLRLT